MGGTVEIVGGGIGGLFTAFLLARQGWRVRVNERQSQIREIGAALFLKNNAVTVLEHVGIADLVLRSAVRLRGAEIRDHKNRVLQRRILSGAARAFNLPRYDVVLGLAQAARNVGVDIATDVPVIHIDPAGSLVLANGETRTADLIIDASGSTSRFRDQLGLTVAARELASGATRHLVPRTNFEVEDVTREWWSGRRRIGIAPSTAALSLVYMTCPEWDKAGSKLPVDVESWKHSFPVLSEQLRRLRHASGGTRHPFTYVRCRKWSNGRVALIGDAAHSMPPTLGQGAGCTLMNAYVLSKELSRSSDLSSALTAWEATIRYVTDETQKWAVRYDALTANWPLWLSTVRRGIIWTFGQSRSLNAKMRIADRTDVTKDKTSQLV